MISLDSEQLQAIKASSPTIVNASAGSGKTRCLIAKIIQLLEKNINPKNICAITFTNKAANEMKKRLKEQNNHIKDMQVSTIHSLCVRIINNFTHYTPLQSPFSIYDETDQLSIIKTIIKSNELPGDPKTYNSAISNIKSHSDKNIIKIFRKSHFTAHLNEKSFIQVYEKYLEILTKNNACDFDDLLIYARNCLEHSDCAEFFSKLWQHILVDEFQDTSLIQYHLINLLYTAHTKTLFVVGDFNQSIYHFRGANPENITDFIRTYHPTVCYLKFNYRSSHKIIEQANQFLQYGEPMRAKNNLPGIVSFTQFQSLEDEAEKISNAIIRYNDFENTAVLFRINARSLLFERVFAQKKIPYKVIGTPYYKRKVSKDLLAYLKASTNRSDIESLCRIINTPPRGFGDKKKEILLREGWPYLEETAKEMPRINTFIKLLNKIKGMNPSDAVNEILFITDYSSILKKDSDRAMLISFQNVIAGFNSIEELILTSTVLEEDSGHGVKLLTAHASKGLEFDLVLIVGVEEEVWPHIYSQNAKEEERLFYVACTRAKKHLNISYSKTKRFRNNIIETDPSSLFLSSYKKHLSQK